MSEGKKYRRLTDQFTIKDVGSTLLNHLAKGLYQPEEVIREYVQNAIDSHRLWKSDYHSETEGPIQIEVRGDKLSILDYGVGMFEDEVRRVKSIAVTTKLDTNVRLTGHKGVGIWAGLSYFDTLILETTRRGSNLGFRLTIHFKRIVDSISDRADIGEVMDNNYFIDVYDEDIDDHYTNVTLDKPTRSNDIFTEVDKIRDAIRRICPCEIDPNFVFYERVCEWYKLHGLETYDIWVQGQPIYRSFPSSLEHFKSSTITVNDVVVAQYWQAINKASRGLKPISDELIGFRIYHTDFALGGENSYSVPKLTGYKPLNTTTPNYLVWHVGEIHITSPTLRPNLQRDQLEESEETRQFIQKLRDFYAKTDEQDRLLSEKRKADEKIADDVRKTIDIYRGYERKVEEILHRDLLVNLSEEDFDCLTSIQDGLEADERRADSASESKKNPHLRDSSVKKLRKKLLDKVGQLLVKPRKAQEQIAEATKDEYSSSPSALESDNDFIIDTIEQTANKEPTIDTMSLSDSIDKFTPLAPEADFAISLQPSSKADTVIESLNSNITQAISFDLGDTIAQREIAQESKGTPNEAEQNEKVFRSSSRKIPVSVVLGLLEEVLNDVLGDDTEDTLAIVTKLKERIDWVLSNA